MKKYGCFILRQDEFTDCSVDSVATARLPFVPVVGMRIEIDHNQTPLEITSVLWSVPDNEFRIVGEVSCVCSRDKVSVDYFKGWDIQCEERKKNCLSDALSDI